MPKIDNLEFKEWIESLKNINDSYGKSHSLRLLNGLNDSFNLENQSYLNTYAPSEKSKSINWELEDSITNRLRWNAIIMIIKASNKAPELGGHIATYASCATLYEVGFNHFFKSKTKDRLQDVIFFQGHSAPGIYARSFFEGRINAKTLDKFRQEAQGKGLSSYPHPWLMPDYWEAPTVSMGLGPLQAIYQARCDKYLINRGLLQTKRKFWVFVGDGETDEPETLSALQFAYNEQLDNLIFVVNCNLQRLDGPVRGNGKIIKELETRFKSANWEVIKLLWGHEFNQTLAKKENADLLKIFNDMPDGDLQRYTTKNGAYLKKHLLKDNFTDFSKQINDDDYNQIKRGGHDPKLVYTAYEQAQKATGPCVILAQTIKGYGLGKAGEAQNITHNKKKLTKDDLYNLKKRFNLSINDTDIEKLNYCNLSKEQENYLISNREKLGGFLPTRHHKNTPLKTKITNLLEPLKENTDREYSTTMALVRAISILLKNKDFQDIVVPITPDESRTFGMEGLFRQYGIYSPKGQLYEPEDNNTIMSYKESSQGIILEEGLNEAGAISSWIALATSYSLRQKPMLPFYIFYSMFGFQRVGDAIWSAADMKARGFLIGATAGKTTLAGEGLQHNDGHNLVWAAAYPNCKSYDPTFSYELAVILEEGINEMYLKQKDIFYYITVMNENYQHYQMPNKCKPGILKGMYLLIENNKAKVELLGSGTILNEVIKAHQVLQDIGIESRVWSVTSFSELKKDAMIKERNNHIFDKKEKSYVTSLLNTNNPVIAATDYIAMQAEQIRSEIKSKYIVLGTDGFGRSDTRKKLRDFHEVSSAYIVWSVICALQLDKDKYKKFRPKSNVKHPILR